MRRPLIAVVSILVLIVAVQRFQDNIPGGDTGASKRITLVHESSQDDPQQGDTYVTLRDGEAAKYLSTKGVVLNVIDRDATNENEKRVLDEMVGTTELPAIFFQAKSGVVVYSQSLGKRFDEKSILALIKKRGI